MSHACLSQLMPMIPTALDHKRTLLSAASSGSDGEGSDASRRLKKLKHRRDVLNSQKGTPNTSRPGSPTPSGAQHASGVVSKKPSKI